MRRLTLFGFAGDSIITHVRNAAKRRRLRTELVNPSAILDMNAHVQIRVGDVSRLERRRLDESSTIFARHVPSPRLTTRARGAVEQRRLASAQLDAWETTWALLADLASRGATVVNDPLRAPFFDGKPRQLQHLVALGLRVPQTLISNDARAFARFADEQGGAIAFKPLVSREVELVATRAFTDHRGHLPMMIGQEPIFGTSLRVTVVGDRVLDCTAYESDAFDVRADSHYREGKPRVSPATLPRNIERDCLRAAKSMGFVIAGIDIIRTQKGEHVFLEFNSMPVFVWLDLQRHGTPIANALLDHLTAGW